jgi:hypothetical protein
MAANGSPTLSGSSLQNKPPHSKLRSILTNDDEADWSVYDSITFKLAELADRTAYEWIMRRFDVDTTWPFQGDQAGRPRMPKGPASLCWPKMSSVPKL